MVSESRKRAKKRYEKQNPDRTRYMKAKASSRSFIRNHAATADLDELKNLIREKELRMSKPIELTLSTDPVVERMIKQAFENPEVPFNLNGTVFVNLKAFYEFLTDNLKRDGDFMAHVDDLIDKDMDSIDEESHVYELGAWETKSGNPETIHFNRKSNYDEIDEEYTYRYEF
ncbi:hypothetical protein [Sporolactobacillus terrae]|uniref:hypothetical protein n=1 Tax=Sporolactobacillus terrae TaxID=269673 RepID=UPI000569F126|nr:hypothetical protein [Sporolactobacillus terrae]